MKINKLCVNAKESKSFEIFGQKHTKGLEFLTKKISVVIWLADSYLNLLKSYVLTYSTIIVGSEVSLRYTQFFYTS